jgi:hypothetical protein
MHRLFRLSIPATLVILAVVMTPRIEAQATRADSAAILLEATRRLELEGESVAAQELMDLIVRHFPGTPAAAEAELTLTASRSQNLERSGRASLIAFSTLYGGWLGVAVPAAFGANEPEPFGAGLLIGAPLGFFASKAIVDRYPMSSGQATLTGFGARWGTWQGIGWREVLGIGSRTVHYCDPYDSYSYCYSYEEDSDEALFTAGIVGGLAGLVTGGLLAQKLNPSHGAATMVELGSLWGVWYGLAGAVVADVQEDNAALTWALMGSNVGLVASALAARSWEMGVGRARIISAAGLAGGVAGLGLDLLMNVDDESVAVLIPTVTSALGLVAGGFMTQRFDSGTPMPNSATAQLGLVSLNSGQWSIGLPAIEPAKMVLPDRMRGLKPGLGARVSVFSAEF